MDPALFSITLDKLFVYHHISYYFIATGEVVGVQQRNLTSEVHLWSIGHYGPIMIHWLSVHTTHQTKPTPDTRTTTTEHTREVNLCTQHKLDPKITPS